MIKRFRKSFSLIAKDSEKLSYDQLLRSNTSDCDYDDPVLPHHAAKAQPHPLRRHAILFAKIMTVTFALLGLANAGHRTISISMRPNYLRSCSCGGTTVAEAIHRGCTFTPLAIAWLPDQCLDRELADEFDAYAEWEYWRDENGTIAMTREEVGLLADTEGAVFYTTLEWHVIHCMFTWRKHYRSQFNGVTIEARSNGIEHIEHCEGIVRDRAPLKKIRTMAGIELNADLH